MRALFVSLFSRVWRALLKWWSFVCGPPTKTRNSSLSMGDVAGDPSNLDAALLVSVSANTPTSGATAPIGTPLSRRMPALLDECWVRAIGFLEPTSLCACARVSCRWRSLSNDDATWKHCCAWRWSGKQGVRPGELFVNGNYSHLTSLTVRECKSLLERRGVVCEHLLEKAELLQQLRDTNPDMIPGQSPLIFGKWKTSYAYAVGDSRRRAITATEVDYFRWHLIYNGVPSRLGLRHFQKDGIFVSPHFGETRWCLEEDGRAFAMQGVARLAVDRNTENWGWMIGAGTGTEYHSVEQRTQGMA